VSASIPVYASHPRRLGVAALLIAACFIVALLAFVGWKIRQGDSAAPAMAEGDRSDSVMSAFPPDATPQRTPRQPDTAASSSPEKSSTPSSTSGAAPAPDAGAAAPVEIKPLPVKPGRPRTSKSTPAPKSAPAAPPSVATEPALPPERPQVVAAAPKAAPAVDRWTQMNEERSRCTREDFISRVICDQRVRFRYCNGYWGKVVQCPGNPVPDR
jgi:hypothetical protein